MKRLIVLVALLVVGCYPGAPVSTNNHDDSVRYLHDDVNHVGCWVYFSNAISCLPDKAYK